MTAVRSFLLGQSRAGGPLFFFFGFSSSSLLFVSLLAGSRSVKQRAHGRLRAAFVRDEHRESWCARVCACACVCV